MSDTPRRIPGAPLLNGLLDLSGEHALRCHMPGHKGRGMGDIFDSIFTIDYTEIDTTGNLYGENGLIQQAELECAMYYGMDRCFFMTCGATQGIKAAIAALCPPGSPLVVDRNCHMSVIDTCAMLDLSPSYVWPAFDALSGVSGDISPSALTLALRQSGAAAAIVTSPTYYGALLDIASLASAAHECGAALIVDAAHGSHLRACGIDDPAAQSADIVIFSAHKTLRAMTQGAYLLSRGFTAPFYENLRRLTALFGTSSPSYPIMASLDYARAMLQNDGGRYALAAQCADSFMRRLAASTPFLPVIPMENPRDPCRLSILTSPGGISGTSAALSLRAAGIEAEMSDRSSVTLIHTADGTLSDLNRIYAALSSLEPHPVPLPRHSPPPRPRRVISPRQAYFSPYTAVPLANCRGKIAARPISPYPPGVPVIAAGEEIDDLCVEYLLNKGYNEVDKLVCISI